MSKPEKLASPDSLFGLLQPGRGEGFIRVLSAPILEAREVLLECVCNDPRLDSQVENRAEYYASIAVKVGFDTQLLAAHLRDQDDTCQSGWNTCLAVETLVELARQRYQNAAGILCDYMAWGQWWDWPLNDLMELSDPQIHLRVAGAIERHFQSDEDLEEACSFHGDWHRSILARQSPRLAKALGNLQQSSGRTPSAAHPTPDLTHSTVKEILELAAGESNRHPLRKAIAHLATPEDVDFLVQNVSLDRPFVADVALAGLARLGPGQVFGWLQEFWTSNQEMPSYLQWGCVKVMVSMPPDLTLPFARERLFHENANERGLAEDLLRAHATREDIPALRAAVKLAIQDEENQCYRLCDLVEAFARFPRLGVVPELVEVFTRFRYSYGRWLAANAIQVTSPDLFRDKFALECLWDCEEGTRVLGAAFVQTEDTSAASARLQELASSAWEGQSVRETARKRLAE